MTGEGMKEFFEAVDNARTEYEKCVASPGIVFNVLAFHIAHWIISTSDYKPEHDRLMAQRQSALDEFRQALHDNAERPYWTPPEVGKENTTPAWREHVAQLTMPVPIGRFYDSPTKPALANNTHAHISKQANETIEHNVARIFRKGEPTCVL